jgi:hypothetical protein
LPRKARHQAASILQSTEQTTNTKLTTKQQNHKTSSDDRFNQQGYKTTRGDLVKQQNRYRAIDRFLGSS